MVDARSVPGAAAQEANFDISPEVRKVLDGANVMMRSLKGEKTQEARSPWCAAPPGQSWSWMVPTHPAVPSWPSLPLAFSPTSTPTSFRRPFRPR
jgi:hypothetical protein